MKKTYLGLGVFALALMVALPALAYNHHNNDKTVEVQNFNNATVTNLGGAVSNTGVNSANYNAGLGIVDTGNATARTTIYNQVNYNETTMSCSNCTKDVDKVKFSNFNNAHVLNGGVSVANTGVNSANGNAAFVGSHCFHAKVGAGVVMTGNAVSGTDMTTVVNTNVTKIK